MTLSECIHILTQHNLWRRGKEPYTGQLNDPRPPEPHDIGLAIDYAVTYLTGVTSGDQLSLFDDSTIPSEDIEAGAKAIFDQITKDEDYLDYRNMALACLKSQYRGKDK